MRILACSFALLLACGGATQNTDADGGSDGSQQGSIDCNGQTCGQGEACVVTTAGGGACQLPNDAGVCPDGTHTTGCCNNLTTTWACAKLPDSCNGTLSCPCGGELCQCGGCEIADAGVMSCTCLYP